MRAGRNQGRVALLALCGRSRGGRSRRVALAAVAAASLVMSSCGGPTEGVITGRVFACGSLEPVPAARYRAGTVSVYRVDGSRVASQRVAKDQAYRFRVAPGRYRIVGEPPLNMVPTAVTLSSGQTVHLGYRRMC